ncbi:uncharacterized protein K02A2.6-like [Asterias rubens]|uniref:uncharacterized protein K02A2.6-like n=1 Tax=Asterias rubens TaxID=7604 RepID=UPI0014555BA2|nr:uncharacterized protein K02A2.6-like [Asterias rubens]
MDYRPWDEGAHIRPACRSKSDQQPSRGPPKQGKGKQKSKPMKSVEMTENYEDASSMFVGRLAINKLDQNKDTKLTALLEEYDELFKEEIGELKGIKGNLILKENAQPVFLKARQVPYALRPKIEAELVKLQRENIITPVETSEWATPIVPVAKKSGGVRICGDFKVTLNANLRTKQYPLPKIEDIFATLAGGQRFSKLDLRQA